VSVNAGPWQPDQRTLQLRDGRRVHVRPIRAEDEPLLHEAFRRMSAQSVYFRFFSPSKRLPDHFAARLARVDYRDRFALVASSHQPDGREHILGVARYDRIPGTSSAEAALAVIDEFQRQGIGSALLRLLARIARQNGIESMVATVLVENHCMLGLLRKLGWLHRTRIDGPTYEISIDLRALDLDKPDEEGVANARFADQQRIHAPR
jgi:ribosomal protein S18 acetylase RimI-like enzyme